LTVPISDKRRILEIIAVVLTASGKFVFMDWLQWRLGFILIAIAAWAAYIYLRKKYAPSFFRCYGFRTDNLKSVSQQLLPFAITAMAACTLTGYFRGTLNITWHIIPIMILYPIWGTLQQFLCVGLVAGNLQDMKNPWKKSLIILVTALLFGLLHYPDIWLMAGTSALAVIYSSIYLRERNLYALGVFHGWLGALFYYSVVGRDPFLEVFGPLIQR
jgi:membrane protease YdiL (CAAX protease family)